MVFAANLRSSVSTLLAPCGFRMSSTQNTCVKDMGCDPMKDFSH